MSWLNGWNQRKSKIIKGSAVGILANYQMKVNIHKGNGTDTIYDTYLSNVRDDFGDIRFTDPDGTLLDYWIEKLNHGTNAIIWVKILSIPSDPLTTNIYIYYDNPSAESVSNGYNTFLFFDDFIDNRNGWTLPQGCTIQDSKLTIGAVSAFPTLSISPIPITNNKGIYYSATILNNGWACCWNTAAYIRDGTNWYGWYITTDWRYQGFFGVYPYWWWSFPTACSWQTDWLCTRWWTKYDFAVLNGYQIGWLNDVLMSISASVPISQVTDLTFYGTCAYYDGQGGCIDVDNVFIRNYASPEPEFVQIGNLSIESSPSGAKIILDSIDTGLVTPTVINNIAIGSHTYTLQLTGYNDYVGTIDILSDQTAAISVALQPIPGSISFESSPSGAKVILDGADIGLVTPITVNDVPVGDHNYTLILADYYDYSGTVNVLSGQTTNVSITLEPKSGSISFESSPSGAKIILDGIDTGLMTPTTVNSVAIGSHTYILQLANYYDYSGTIDVLAGQTSIISTILQPITGDLYISSIPQGATIYIDNVSYDAITPTNIIDIPIGTHSFLLMTDIFTTSDTFDIFENTLTVIEIIMKTGNVTKRRGGPTVRPPFGAPPVYRPPHPAPPPITPPWM